MHTQLLVLGTGLHGQLGLGKGVRRTDKPVVVPTLARCDVRAVAGGHKHAAAVDRVGRVWAWGDNQNGQLGEPPVVLGDKSAVPVCVARLQPHRVVSVACGDSHTAAVTSRGHLWLWGDDSAGQCGQGRVRVSAAVPERVRGHVFRKVACGNRFTIAIGLDGAVYAWGDGADGRLGLDDDHRRHSVPTRIHSLAAHPMLRVAAAGRSAAAITERGSVYVWGAGIAKPMKLRHGLAGHPVERVALTHLGGIAVTRAGVAFSWTWQDTQTVRRIEALAGVTVVRVAAARHHLAVVSHSGAVYTWGEGQDGQLGHVSRRATTLTKQATRVRALRSVSVRLVACTAHTTMVVAATSSSASSADQSLALPTPEFRDATAVLREPATVDRLIADLDRLRTRTAAVDASLLDASASMHAATVAATASPASSDGAEATAPSGYSSSDADADASKHDQSVPLDQSLPSDPSDLARLRSRVNAETLRISRLAEYRSALALQLRELQAQGAQLEREISEAQRAVATAGSAAAPARGAVRPRRDLSVRIDETPSVSHPPPQPQRQQQQPEQRVPSPHPELNVSASHEGASSIQAALAQLPDPVQKRVLASLSRSRGHEPSALSDSDEDQPAAGSTVFGSSHAAYVLGQNLAARPGGVDAAKLQLDHLLNRLRPVVEQISPISVQDASVASTTTPLRTWSQPHALLARDAAAVRDRVESLMARLSAAVESTAAVRLDRSTSVTNLPPPPPHPPQSVVAVAARPSSSVQQAHDAYSGIAPPPPPIA